MTAYGGDTYRKPKWDHHVFRTEYGIYETICISGGSLSNAVVEAGLVRLVRHVRAGSPPTLQKDELGIDYEPGQEEDFLVWNVRRNWTILFQEVGPVEAEALVGILRTLLHSMQAQAWLLGPDRGYVAFLTQFIPGATRGRPEKVHGSILPLLGDDATRPQPPPRRRW